MSAELGDFTKVKRQERRFIDTKYHPDSGRKEDKTRLVAHFLNLVYLDDASSQGYMHIDKSMNEEVHALACCILS